MPPRGGLLPAMLATLLRPTLPASPPPAPMPTVNAGEQLPGPADPTNATAVAEWRVDIAKWKGAVKQAVKYNDSLAESYYVPLPPPPPPVSYPPLTSRHGPGLAVTPVGADELRPAADAPLRPLLLRPTDQPLHSPA